MAEQKKILLVEDEEIIYNLLQKKLKGAGYEVKIAKNGEEALDSLEEEKPDVLLLDIVMPKKGGFEVMEEMQEKDGLEGIPVIVISNSGQPVELDKAKKLGADDWLIKTEFDPDEVIEKVGQSIK